MTDKARGVIVKFQHGGGQRFATAYGWQVADGGHLVVFGPPVEDDAGESRVPTLAVCAAGEWGGVRFADVEVGAP